MTFFLNTQDLDNLRLLCSHLACQLLCHLSSIINIPKDPGFLNNVLKHNVGIIGQIQSFLEKSFLATSWKELFCSYNSVNIGMMLLQRVIIMWWL